MNRRILFIHGGGDDGFSADKPLTASLQSALGNSYSIDYPKMPADEGSADFGWLNFIGKKIADNGTDIILVGHSLGASMLLKYLSENNISKKVIGVFLLATPFWEGNEEWKKGLVLRENFQDLLPTKTPVYFYHCRDDEEIAVSHLEMYKVKIQHATFREIARGGHQFNNVLSEVAQDIKAIG